LPIEERIHCKETSLSLKVLKAYCILPLISIECCVLDCVVLSFKVATKRVPHKNTKSEASNHFVGHTCNVKVTSQYVRWRTLCCSRNARVSARCHC
jgi:hypothetical protein